MIQVRSMIPLETLDGYMILCGVLGVTYMIFMLGVLLCFLRKYNCTGLSQASCPQMEMRPVGGPEPYRYTVVTQSSDSITPSFATRSNRSFCSKNSSHIYYKPQQAKKTFVRTVPDFSKMERLATL